MPASSSSLFTSLILCPISFFLGVIFLNWTYDHHTLWDATPQSEAFAASKAHYKQIADAPYIIQHVFHGIVAVGLVGFLAKLYKPSESNRLFDGGSLVLYMAALIVYLTNIRRGFFSVFYNDWGEVSEEMGLNVMAASQTIAAVCLLGALGLQAGQFYAERQNDIIAANARQEESAEAPEAKKTK
ncbi:Shr3 amino acid permease chaperone [Dipodascopsis tothii]|uniref:Shr3 amino acid permease chaperone n=1 Tax=Dipodascopsis tothii TaxID=44089 RepID=UPI0034CFD96F